MEAYIKTVCKITQMGADVPLPPMKAETKIVWCELVLAMASVECGLSADDRDTLRYSVAKGWNMLF